MRSVLFVLAFACSLSACVPPSGSFPRPDRIPPIASKVAVHTPTEIKVFEEFKLDKMTLCRARAGLGSEAHFRAQQRWLGRRMQLGPV